MRQPGTPSSSGSSSRQPRAACPPQPRCLSPTTSFSTEPPGPRHLPFHSFQGLLHERLNLFKALLCFCLEAQHQDGLGIRSANQPPAIREHHPHPVHVDDRVSGATKGVGGPSDNVELRL